MISKNYNNRYLSAYDVVKFSLLVGLAAIFIDSVIAHGLFWENDPYWTYLDY